jgi:mannan endo-1,4-beta-mannosidase
MKRSAAPTVPLLLLLCIAPLAAGAQPSGGERAPVNPRASAEARALLKYLYSISGRHTLVGQHNFPNTIANWTNRAYDFTGEYPAVFGQDFGFQGGIDKDSVLARPALVEESKRQYRNGAIVTFTWHAVRPTEDEPVTFRDSVQGKLSDFEWRELTTPSTNLHTRWCAQVDVVAGFLKQLRDARVPVLWRPYHEVNGSWFWWGGRKGKDGSAALYRQMYDRFVNLHRLDNLLWVWNANAPGSDANGPGPYADYFPGLEYADVLSVDIYGEFKSAFYDDILTVADGKPVALGEVGAVPAPAVLVQQPRWTWFMTWADLLEGSNSVESVRAVYAVPSALSRDEPAVAGPMAGIRASSDGPQLPEPVTPQATKAARDLVARLLRAQSAGVLIGQDNDPRSPAAASGQIAEITGRQPALFGQDLGVADEPGADPATARAAVVEECKRQQQRGAIVTLSWRPARPTDEESGATLASARGKLSDFEWEELITPGTSLHERWRKQVETVAVSLRQLQDAGVAVLWRPYPQPNGSKWWWAGRKGLRGSAALYRLLFERLVSYHQLRSLAWVWSAAAPGFGPSGPGQYADHFPGLLYVDALAVDLEDGRFAFRRDADLARFAVGKPIGLGTAGFVPAPEMFGPQSQWTWLLISPADARNPERAEALKTLYESPRIVSAAAPR